MLEQNETTSLAQAVPPPILSVSMLKTIVANTEHKPIPTALPRMSKWALKSKMEATVANFLAKTLPRKNKINQAKTASMFDAWPEAEHFSVPALVMYRAILSAKRKVEVKDPAWAREWGCVSGRMFIILTRE